MPSTLTSYKHILVAVDLTEECDPVIYRRGRKFMVSPLKKNAT